MAALMTSVIEMPNKVAEYILVCRQMGIRILPPDINRGIYGFSVDDGAIRYGLSAIKSVGRPVIEALVQEREERGEYRSLKDFIERNITQVNKESHRKLHQIRSHGLSGRQPAPEDDDLCADCGQHQPGQKHTMAGQLSFFDIVSEEDKHEFEIRMPDLAEYDKEMILAFEKEVLGIYLSGHPLERYRSVLERTISAKTTDFLPDEETGQPWVYDGQKVIVGGMITDKTIKYTKNNKVMAFLTVEDLVGTVEIVVFPRDYEKYQQFMEEEAKVFVQGRVSAEDDKASKLILEKVRTFEDVPRELWVQFADKGEYSAKEQELLRDLQRSKGTAALWCI